MPDRSAERPALSWSCRCGFDVKDAEIDRLTDWQDFAACKGQTTLFFARKAERPQARARREAKAAKLCALCPVQPLCLEFSRENREYGFWAGESEEERHLAGYTLTAPIGIRARPAKNDSPIAS
jgi:WhiB family redox-sensing transcriptional regulator